MAYDPYQDVASLLAGVKRDAQSAAASAVNDILKSNNTVYKATYSDAAKQVKDTRAYILSGKAYSDEGAQAIRAAYASQAQSAAEGAAADAAADNAGNLDSYAAAQANRQKQAFVSAGEEAVAKRAQQLQDALRESDKNLISAYDTMQSALTDGAQTAMQNAKNASAASSDALNALLDYYGVLIR